MKHFYIIMASVCIFATTASAQMKQPRRVATLEQPIVHEATNITSNGFTANWEPVSGAEAYCVFVYLKNVAAQDGEYTIVDEDFDGIDFGSLIEPGGGDESWVDLSAYGYAYTFGWEAYAYPNFVPSMVAGLLYSPYLDLENDGGKYKLLLTTYSNQGDEIRVESHGSGDKEVVIYTADLDNSQATGMFTKELEFENGIRDVFFSAINVTAEPGTADYTDRVQVTQNLKAGDVYYTNIAADEAVMAEDDYGFEVTSKRFTLPARYLNGNTEVYYDVYAALHDFSTPNGSTPYTLVTSPYSSKVLVDLKNRTSEVIEETSTAVEDLNMTRGKVADDAWYDLSGRRVMNPTQGIYIHHGEKVIIK